MATGLGSILIIDDCVELLNLYQNLLSDEGYQVHCAPNGERALEVLKSIGPPDLMLVDCAMPAMSGSELLREVEGKFPDVFARSKIIGFSSFRQEALPSLELEELVDGFMEKPHDIFVFLDEVKKLLV